MEVANRVKEVRLERGMPVAELARRVGVTRQTIYTIEAGKDCSTVGVMRRVAEVLGVSLAEIFNDAEAVA